MPAIDTTTAPEGALQTHEYVSLWWRARSYVSWGAIASLAIPATLISLQLAGLWALNFAGFWVVQKTALPIPGNLVGMLTLFVLLVAGVVRVSWFELTGSFLIKHLAFFFVPITVGLMNAGPLLIAHGIGIILVLTISAAGGILLTGLISQVLLAKRWQAGDRL
jgi:holin-like protein